ncbi:MAG: 4-(cytidine 5'-diphospho)-2-C-methyl-D-erythritol kinase [Ginsengibacter sp.]
MVTFSNCKINLGLNILRKREDGYNDIHSLFLPVPWYDVLEIIPSNTKHTKIYPSGFDSGNPSENLCLKAYYLVKKDYPELPELSIYLHKTIPAGSGLGGGSSNATFMLLLLNEKFDLKISSKKLFSYAEKLGSDCPFFIINKPVLAQGKGQILESYPLSFSGKKFLILFPGIHINTSKLFEEIKPTIPEKPIVEILRQPLHSRKNELKNDFEEIAFQKFPLLEKTKIKLYEFGAEYASMTGSGSTIFAIFSEDSPENFPIDSHWICKWIKI